MPARTVDKLRIFNEHRDGTLPASCRRRSQMKIKWILLAVAVLGTLAGARAEDQTAAARPPVVRAVEFKNFHGVSVKEIVNRLNDRDIRLVEEPYSKEYVATVQGIVEELMAEKGQVGVRVKPTVVPIPPHSVRVTFTAAN
jgi:outer membrane protein assembly factor BamA